MIRYRRLYESENSDIKLYDVVRCAGYEWYVIDKQGDVVILLAKDADFGECMFDEESNDYKNSEIREYLKNRVFPELQSANPIPARLSDVGVTDKVWLLSVNEAKKLPLHVKKFGHFKWIWWLRSPGRYSNDTAYVDSVGSVHTGGNFVDRASVCVRPAMQVRVEDLEG